MAIPKAKSAVEVADHEVEKKALLTSFKEAKRESKVDIKPIECLNEFIAIMPIVIESGIVLPETAITNEGIVVGVGPGLPSGGGRVASQLKIGDVVLYNSKNTLTRLEPSEGVYKGKSIFITQERSVYCILRRADFRLV